MIRKLFETCDANNDGLLSMKEFNSYILDVDPKTIISHSKKNESKSEFSDNLSLNISDDEDDMIFRKKTLTDHELFKKVYLSLI
jgi:hypothetical protein